MPTSNPYPPTAVGISRSSTVVMAFLMKFHNMMLRDAHKLVKSQRPKVNNHAMLHHPSPQQSRHPFQ